MAKPILVIGVPSKVSGEEFREVKNRLSEYKELQEDYHVLIYTNHIIDETKFEVFYEKDFNEVKYKELKAIIEKAVNRK